MEAPNLPKQRPGAVEGTLHLGAFVLSTLSGRERGLGCLKQFPQHMADEYSCLLLKTVRDRADYNGICFVGLRHWFALPQSWDRVTMGDTFSNNCVGKSLMLYLFILFHLRKEFSLNKSLPPATCSSPCNSNSNSNPESGFGVLNTICFVQST